jgi:hypothetical protein
MHTTSRRSRAGAGLLAAAALSLTVTIAGSASAEALVPTPPPALVKAGDTWLKTQCRFTVTGVNFDTGMLTGRLTSQSQSARLLGSLSVASARTSCTLWSDTPFPTEASLLAGIADSSNSAYTYVSKVVTVPLALSYDLYVYTPYELRNGTLGVVEAYSF